MIADDPRSSTTISSIISSTKSTTDRKRKYMYLAMGKPNLSGHHAHEIYNHKVKLFEKQRERGVMREIYRNRDTD